MLLQCGAPLEKSVGTSWRPHPPGPLLSSSWGLAGEHPGSRLHHRVLPLLSGTPQPQHEGPGAEDCPCHPSLPVESKDAGGPALTPPGLFLYLRPGSTLDKLGDPHRDGHCCNHGVTPCGASSEPILSHACDQAERQWKKVQ